MSLKNEILKMSRQDQTTKLSDWFDSKLTYLIEQGYFPDLNALEDMHLKIVNSLCSYRKLHKIHNVVIGMSGGVDSALTASLFKKANWDVTAFLLPIHQNEIETQRGVEVCEALGIDYTILDLSKLYDATVKQLSAFDKNLKNETIRCGNIKARLRMTTLYNMASGLGGLVASTDNLSELAAGFWTLHGDVGDLAPVQSLSKSWEIPMLAKICNVPENVYMATPTDGLGISDSDETQFGYTYLEADIILLSLLDSMDYKSGMDDNRVTLGNKINLSESGASREEEVYIKVCDRLAKTAFKRKNPANVQHPIFSQRYNQIATLDNIMG